MCWQLSLALTFLSYIYCSSWVWEPQWWNATHILSNKSKSSWLECDKLYPSIKTKEKKNPTGNVNAMSTNIFWIFLVDWGAWSCTWRVEAVVLSCKMSVPYFFCKIKLSLCRGCSASSVVSSEWTIHKQTPHWKSFWLLSAWSKTQSKQSKPKIFKECS